MPENYVNMGLEATRWGSKKVRKGKIQSKGDFEDY